MVCSFYSKRKYKVRSKNISLFIRQSYHKFYMTRGGGRAKWQKKRWHHLWTLPYVMKHIISWGGVVIAKGIYDSKTILCTSSDSIYKLYIYKKLINNNFCWPPPSYFTSFMIPPFLWTSRVFFFLIITLDLLIFLNMLCDLMWLRLIWRLIFNLIIIF